MEKPYLIFDNITETYNLCVPTLRKATDSSQCQGSNLDKNETDDIRSFEKVYMAVAGSGQDIQSRLDQGYDVIFTPGIYYLTQPLIIRKTNQVLLGLGLATLIASPHGCIIVKPNLYGVRIAGLMLQAAIPAVYKGSFLLKIGEEKRSMIKLYASADSSNNNNNNNINSSSPAASKDTINNNNNDSKTVEESSSTTNNTLLFTPSCVLSDVFCRVGGPDVSNRTEIGVETMVAIHSDYVIGDNLWLWRADHSQLEPGEIPRIDSKTGRSEQYHLVEYNKTAQLYEFPCNHALYISGDHVLMYGLAAEHTLHTQVVWKGNYGVTYFFQSELPYDVINNGYASYVGYELQRSTVTHHVLVGAGIYSYFRDEACQVVTAITTPLPDLSLLTSVFDYVRKSLSPDNNKNQSDRHIKSVNYSIPYTSDPLQTATQDSIRNPFSDAKNTTITGSNTTNTNANATNTNDNNNSLYPDELDDAEASIQLINIFTVFLNGKGGIDSILNFPTPPTGKSGSSSSMYYGGGRIGDEVNEGKFNCKYINHVFIKPAPTSLQPKPIQQSTAEMTTHTNQEILNQSKNKKRDKSWFSKFFQS